jgi:radical SAM protein with 4Fe4S-binding SPASM domain
MALADYRRIIDESKGRVFQVALGGRGDPELHEDFEALAAYTRQNDIVPNLTTSGFGLTPARARIIARYCGAAAVSWYRSEYTLRAIELMLEAGIKTNIHFVLSNSSIEEALRLLETGGFPPGINRVVFLLHKPVGLGTQDNVLQANDPRVQQFFSLVSEPENTALVGFDSCTVPGLINMAPTLLPMTYDACEGARFSAYVTPDLKLTPCSFDQTLRWGVDLRKLTIAEAWNSTEFEAFRETLRSSCRRCRHRARCLGGCPISPEITLCEKAQLEGTT